MLSQGTKGKGSVAAMVATALQAAGLRVGLYMSPHGNTCSPYRYTRPSLDDGAFYFQLVKVG
jgi:hypothetical protein